MSMIKIEGKKVLLTGRGKSYLTTCKICGKYQLINSAGYCENCFAKMKRIMTIIDKTKKRLEELENKAREWGLIE